VLFLMRISDRKAVQLTSDRYSADGLAFTPDNRWLYFLSDRTLNATNGSPWGSRNMGPLFEKRDRIYAIALQAGQRFPFAGRDELSDSTETPAPAAPAAPPATTPVAPPTAAAAAQAAAPAPTPAPSAAAGNTAARTFPIDWEGLDTRLHEVPLAALPAGNYRSLKTDGRRLYVIETDGAGGFGAARGTLKSIAIDNNATPAETHSTDVTTVQISANGRKMLVARQTGGPGPGGAREFFIYDTGARPPQGPEAARAAVRVGDWQIKVNPREDWKQMFADAWRLHRDYFYDPNMHGHDWKAIRAKYEPLLPRVTERTELGDLMAQMVAEINALHSQVGSGSEVRAGEDVGVSTAGLGADFSKVADGLRIDRIYAGEPELPGERGPLAQPGRDFAVGDVITAINGQTARNAAELGELLRNQAGRQVLLSYKRGSIARQAVVVPVNPARERSLRYTHWEVRNRQKVEQASEGKFGYIHLRAMTSPDVDTFAREFYSVFDREGLIIDVRGNDGGNIDSIIIEKLMRRAWAYWQSRRGDGGGYNMQAAFRGQLVVLIDENTYSDGETFSEGIKRLGMGTLIGKQTAGAGVWLSNATGLMDGGIMRAAEFGQYGLDGTWLIEGIGVVPDIEVDMPPRASFDGADAQLDAGIAHLRKLTAEKPLRERQPAFPKR
jgi:tricorn protease